jgi:hypothetical protein
VSTTQIVQRESVPHKAGVENRDRRGLSLLQPGRWKPDVEMKLDPGDFRAGAGAPVKPSALELWQDTGEVGTVKYQDPTDPITHFQHENLPKTWEDIRIVGKGRKKPEGTHRAAQQSWTWSREEGIREAMGLVTEARAPLKKRQQFVYDQHGNWVYCIHGIEDMRPRATQNYIKLTRK